MKDDKDDIDSLWIDLGGRGMKCFQCLEVEEAVAYAAAGGQALHLHRIIVDESRAPR
jgi:hypothetical protein